MNHMKKLLTIVFGVAMGVQGFAQWQPNGATSGNIYYNGGNVGIGVSPLADLHISRANTSTNLLIENSQSASDKFPGINITNYKGSSIGHPYINLSNANGSLATPTSMSSNTLGALIFSGHNGNGFIQAARIQVEAGAAFTSTSTPTNMLFSTASPNTTYYSEKMRITSDGNVGIGTASPITQLTMMDTNMGGPVNTAVTPNLGLSLTGNGTGGTLNMGIDATGANFYSWIQSRNRTNTGTYPIALNPAGGNVGIGTPAPAGKLDVRGGTTRIINYGTGYNLISGNADPGINDSYFYHLTSTNYHILGSNKNGSGLMRKLGFAIGGGDTESDVKMMIDPSGNVGIGNTNPDAKLTVTGQVHAQEVKVTVSAPGPDYVFEKDYSLPSLDQIKTYIEENKHLPEVPSAKEMEKNGVQLGEMNMLLLKKIEELTLYVIELKRQDDIKQKEIEMLKSRIK
jgi:hypothetical protein